MNKILIDSSVWISYFRGKDDDLAKIVNTLLEQNQAALCGMIELEILQGLRDSERSTIINLFEALHFIDTLREDYITAGLLINDLRRKGITIAPSDCLIGAVCSRNNIALYTLDNDFNYLPIVKKYPQSADKKSKHGGH